MNALVRAIDWINLTMGWLLAGLGLILILVQFALVIIGHVFSEGSIWVQDSRFFLNSAMFLGAAGYTMLTNDHVRVDLFYRTAPARNQAMIDLLGVLALLSPVLYLIWWTGVPYVLESWAQREGAIESGAIDAVYILKSFILLFAFTLTIQAVSLALKAWTALRGETA